MDAHTVARIWRFLLDAHFLTDRSREVRIKVPVLNRRAKIFSFWHLKISMSQTGRIIGRATITNAPMYSSSDSWSLFDVYSVAIDVVLVILTLLHTLSVSGLLAPCSTFLLRRLRPLRDERDTSATDMPVQSIKLPSRWFQLLCQFSCGALTMSIFYGMYLNSSALRYVLIATYFPTTSVPAYGRCTVARAF